MNHREMKALAENADSVRSLAGYLLQLQVLDPQLAWSDWELDFLANMQAHKGPEPLTMRQVEVLVELRDAAKTYTRLGGMDVVSLINGCWLARFDLDEDGEAFVVSLKASGTRGLKRRQALRLLALARELDIVEGYVAVE